MLQGILRDVICFFGFNLLVDVCFLIGVIQAEVPDCTWACVDIGLGFHVECKLEEAEKIAKSRGDHFREQVSRCDQLIGSIRAHIKLITQALSITRGKDHTAS